MAYQTIANMENKIANLVSANDAALEQLNSAMVERDAFASQVERLLSCLQDAHLSLGFLSTHLRGRMAEQALLAMAKEADEWKELCQIIRNYTKAGE